MLGHGLEDVVALMDNVRQRAGLRNTMEHI